MQHVALMLGYVKDIESSSAPSCHRRASSNVLWRWKMLKSVKGLPIIAGVELVPKSIA